MEFIKTINNRADYFEYQALNYSTLKSFTDDPESLTQPAKESNSGMNFGSAVDTMLFDGQEVFDEDFYTFNAQKPTASTLTLAEAYISVMKDSKIKSRDVDMALSMIANLNLWSNIKKRTTLEEKLTDEFWDYIDAVIESGDRTVIDMETVTKIGLAVDTLRSHDLTSKCYINEPHIENVYQLGIVFSHNDLVYKILLDQIQIDHVAKTVEPIDLKTMEANAKGFAGNAIMYRYDLQAELYTMGVVAYMQKAYPNYTLLPFKFVVISQGRLDKPFVYVMQPTWRATLNINRYTPLLSVDEIVEEFKWHSEKQLWVYPREIYEKGFIELK